MNPYYLLVILAAFLNTIANMMIKTGANKIGNIPDNTGEIIPFLARILGNWFLIFGLGVFGISFLLWVLILNKVQLSAAAPLMSTGYVFILIMSYFLFKEPITLTKAAGIMIIFLGVVVITR
jgi:drug/metabolite transporter (DMT)-like permease